MQSENFFAHDTDEATFPMVASKPLLDYSTDNLPYSKVAIPTLTVVLDGLKHI
jgi:hypothetical protein